MMDDETTEMCDRTATAFWRPELLWSTLATAVQAYRDQSMTDVGDGHPAPRT
jgi:hypothetical protein